MNVLEKILEEISEVEKEYVSGHKVLYALGATVMATKISGIIRSHMDEENLELIWERKEPKKMTVEEMRQKLEELTGEEIEVTE